MKGLRTLGAAVIAFGLTLTVMPIAHAAPEDTLDNRSEWVSPDEGRTNPTAAAVWVIAPIPYDSETGASEAQPDGFSITIDIGDGHNLNEDEGFVVMNESNALFDSSRFTHTESEGLHRFDFAPLAENERFKIQFFTDITDNSLLDFAVQVLNNNDGDSIWTGVLILPRSESGDEEEQAGEPTRLVYVGVFVYIDSNANGQWDAGEEAYEGAVATISGEPALPTLTTDANGEARTPTFAYQPGDENRTLSFKAPEGYLVAGNTPSFNAQLTVLAEEWNIGITYQIPIRPLEDEPATDPEPEPQPDPEPEPEDTPEEEPLPAPPTEPQPPRLAQTGAGVGITPWVGVTFLLFGLILITRSLQAADRAEGATR